MSRHSVNVVRLGKIEKHPNADKLGITHIYGYTVVVGLNDWKEGDLGAYIEPDYVVGDDPVFDFLGSHKRIRVKRLRGVISQGLLIPARKGWMEGQNVMEELGVIRYEPPVKAWNGNSRSLVGGDDIAGPLVHVPHYDLESGYRFNQVLERGEKVYITEKIHGANARYMFDGEVMWAGSRTKWKKPGSNNAWWAAVTTNPWIEEWCRKNPNAVLFGEVFGEGVQDLHYGRKYGEPGFVAFDVFRNGMYMHAEEFHTLNGITRAPMLYLGTFHPDIIDKVVDGDSMLGGNIREGVVVKPANERMHMHIGRVALKYVSNNYLERA